LVGSDGQVIATTSVDPAPFRAHTLMSWTSASRTLLYYLNGGSAVRFLGPSGITGTSTTINLRANQQAGFAVSPDDRRIAVAIFSYLPPADTQGPAIPSYAGMRLYVEDLQGGGHHLEIFESKTVAEFPVAWTAGRLILAVGVPLCCQVLPINPYNATSYHVVDPGTGTRLASLCEKSNGPEGPIEPAGAACFETTDGPTFQRWDGSRLGAPAAVPNPSQYLNAMAPDGNRVAVGGEPIWVWGPSGRGQSLRESGYVFGWLDTNRIVFQRKDANTLSVLDLATNAAGDISSGNYLGKFPAPLT
jgi:hypothetical protein